MSELWDFEVRLRQALAPVDPPADLEERLQSTLGSLAGLIEGRVEPARFTSSLTAPKKKSKARAA